MPRHLTGGSLFAVLILALTGYPSGAAPALFGPENFVRSTGKPEVVRRTFPAAADGIHTLCVANRGIQQQYGAVTSAEIGVNGSAVFQPRHFKQLVTLLKSDVTLGTSNTLSVSIASAPGSGLTVWIASGADADCSAPGANRTPVADAGADRQVPFGSAFAFDGSKSSDPDGDTLTFSWTLTGKPGGSNATLTGTSTPTPTLQPDGAGDYVAELTVGDGRGGTAMDSVVITVLASTNSAPTITSLPITIANHLEPYLYQVTASDPDNDTLSFSLPVAPDGMSINAQSGAIAWTPPGAGALDVTVRADDGRGGVATQTFVVSVTLPANRPPQLRSVPAQTTHAGELFRLRLVADDPDYADPLTFSLLSAPPGASIVSSSLIEWTPGAAQTGTHSFTARVQDSAGTADSESFTVDVAATNRPPAIGSLQNVTASPGVLYTLAVPASDPDSDALTFSLLSGPAGLTVGSSGLLSWTPQVTQLGSHDVRVAVADPAGLIDAGLFRISVEVPVSAGPPVALNDAYAVRRNKSLAVPAAGVMANDSDPGSRPLTAQLVTAPAKGTASLLPDGSFTYTPTQPAPGSTTPVLAFELRRPNVAVTGVDNGPYVADLNRDGKPEIITHASGTFTTRRLDSVHGDGTVRFSIDVYQLNLTPRLALRDELALGDLDGDGRVEIVAIDEDRQRLVALNHDGSFRWMSDDVEDGVGVLSSGGFFMPTIADINGDGLAEILVSHRAAGPAPLNATQDYLTAYDSAGRILWHCRGGTDTSNAAEVVAADLDLDGRLELLFANDACDSNGNLLWSVDVPSGSSIRDMAVANLDDDPFGEVVYLRGTEVRVYEHTGVIRGAPVALPGSGVLSRPIVADVNGDGRPEILVARDDHLVILNRDLSLQRLIDIPGSWGGTPTVFDLNGDGKPEIIHHSAHGPFDTTTGDPQSGALMIFDGSSGALLHAMDADRHSADELTGPIVADVDGDGSAAIVTRAWNEDFVTVRVFKAATGKWAKSRAVWNQYAYSVTNVNADGSIPRVPVANWLTPGLNNYNVNEPLPGERTGDTDSFTYQVSNGALVSNVATVHLDVLPPNNGPRILSLAPSAATPGVQFLYNVRAIDPDAGETLTFSLALAPAGMTVDTSTGLIRWTPGALGQGIAVVKVTDSQGESDSQQFVVAVGPPVAVPSVTGATLTSARASLGSAGLVANETMSPSANVTAGVVITQHPQAGATVAAGSSVAIVVSSGPAPAVVPHVVGKREAAARSQITAAGFGAIVARAFSGTVPQGEVVSQTPAAGTLLVPGAVTMTVSAGPGIALRLARALTPATQAIPFTLVSYDLTGVETPIAGAALTVTAARTPFAGPMPAVAGNAIVPSPATRGAFRLTATDPSIGRTASAEFAVVYGRPAGVPSMMDDYASLTETMADIDALVRQGAAALAADDTVLMLSLLDQMVQRWRQVDITALQFNTPFALESGFPPRPSDLGSLGLTPAADDLLALRVLNDAARDLQAWIDGHRAPTTSMAQLNTLADAFATRAARLNGLQLSEWGLIRAQSTMALIVSRRIPALYDAIMADLAQVVAHGSPAPDFASGPFADADSTLAEQLTKMAMEFVVDKMTEHFTQTYKGAKQFATDVLFQAAWGAGAVALSQHVRGWVQGQDITAVVAGSSMSFRVFESPGSLIEGEIDVDNPEMNVVVLVGPKILAPLSQAIDQFKDLMQYKKTLDPNGGARSIDDVVTRLKAFYHELLALSGTAQDVVQVVKNAFQAPQSAIRGCLFSSAGACNGAVFTDGFKSVYEYAPPPGFGCFTGLPLPILTLLYSPTSGTMYFDTPPFFPTPPGGGASPPCGG
jgi:hypothetical protein